MRHVTYSIFNSQFLCLIDGLLKMFDVFYYEEIMDEDIAATLADAHSKEQCADYCVSIGCQAFDVTPMSDDTYHCDFAMAGYNTTSIMNENRTFNHFKVQNPGMSSNFLKGQCFMLIKGI